jgi:predicted ATP-grasp superfamily ATP-dependent carboligase
LGEYSFIRREFTKLFLLLSAKKSQIKKFLLGRTELNPNVLITDGDLRVTLPVLRSLARNNIETTVAVTKKRALSYFSRYYKKGILYPCSRENLHYFLFAIQKIVESGEFDILFPIGEWTLFPISKYREKIAPHVKLPLGNHDIVEKTLNKRLTLKLANDEGVPIPRTFFVKNLQELKEASTKISYPAVIKPQWSWVWKDDKALFRRPDYVSTPEELISVYKTVHRDFPFPLIQEFIPGKTYDVAVLHNHSKLRAICCIEEHRTTPVTGGYSSLRESVVLNSKMETYVLRLLKALEWYGVAEFEFKLDPRDSIPKLMEINGRFWGSLEVAIDSGIDFPYLLYRLIVDGDVPPKLNYKVGVKRRWLEGDILHLTSVLRNDAPEGITYPDRLKTISNFLKFYEKNLRYDSLYLEDPVPFLSRFLYGEIPSFVSNKLRRMTGKNWP